MSQLDNVKMLLCIEATAYADREYRQEPVKGETHDEVARDLYLAAIRYVRALLVDVAENATIPAPPAIAAGIETVDDVLKLLEILVRGPVADPPLH